MTFNIRYRQGDAGKQRWSRRRALVVSRIRARDPDLVGLQECNDDAQGRYVARQLAEWTFYGARSEDAACPMEMTPILVKRAAFEIVDRSRFWLSETPSVPGSRSWGSAFARVATWARVRERATGRTLVFLSIHVDFAPRALESSAAVLIDWMRQHAGTDPIVIAGDFNAGPESSLYRDLTSAGSLFDVYGRVHSGEPAGTFHDYGANPVLPIDGILASDHFAAVDAQVDRFSSGGRFPSDHYPLIAALEWRSAI